MNSPRLSYFRVWRGTGRAGLLAGCGGGGPAANEAPPATIVVTAKVAPIEWRDTIEALGTARAKESVTLTAKVSETVRKVGFDSGDLVRAGDVIVDLSSGAQLAGLEETRAAYQETERQLARGLELAPTKVISESQLDTQRSNRDAAKARMDVVRAQLSDRVITAPFDGVLACGGSARDRSSRPARRSQRSTTSPSSSSTSRCPSATSRCFPAGRTSRRTAKPTRTAISPAWSRASIRAWTR